MRFVLDASITMAWCFDDETAREAEATLMRLVADDEAVAPALWLFEIGNALAVGERRGRITPDAADRFVARLTNYPIRIEAGTLESIGPILEISRRYRLSGYDAAYLELALRERLPLITIDAALRAAAHKAGVSTALPR